MRKMSTQEKNDEEYNVRGNRRCGLFSLVMKMRMWVGPCSEIGPAVRASSRCAGGNRYCVRGRTVLCFRISSGVSLRSFSDEKKKRDGVFGSSQVRLRMSEKDSGKGKKDGGKHRKGKKFGATKF